LEFLPDQKRASHLGRPGREGPQAFKKVAGSLHRCWRKKVIFLGKKKTLLLIGGSGGVSLEKRTPEGGCFPWLPQAHQSKPVTVRTPKPEGRRFSLGAVKSEDHSKSPWEEKTSTITKGGGNRPSGSNLGTLRTTSFENPPTNFLSLGPFKRGKGELPKGHQL